MRAISDSRSEARWDALAAEALLCDRKPPKDLSAVCLVHFGDSELTVRCGMGMIAIDAGSHAQPDATVAGDARSIRAVLLGERSLANAVSVGDVQLTGNRTKARAVMALFRQE